MSYRCDICGIKVPPRQPRLSHLVYKTWPDGTLKQPKQIAKDLSCCDGCHLMLDDVPLKSVKDPYYLRPRGGDRATVTVVTEVPDPLPPTAEQIGRPAKTVTL